MPVMRRFPIQPVAELQDALERMNLELHAPHLYPEGTLYSQEHGILLPCSYCKQKWAGGDTCKNCGAPKP